MTSTTTQVTTAFMTAALWTPAGRGAVATIRVVGERTGDGVALENLAVPFRAANRRPLAHQVLNTVVFGLWGDQPTEDVVVCRLNDWTWEIHCHGGVAAARRILQDCSDLGISIVDWSAQLPHEVGLLQSEARALAVRATTFRTATLLLEQPDAWLRLAEDIRHFARNAAWEAAIAAIDYVDSWNSLARCMSDPFRVVLTGPPNVGKSALMNALVGFQRSVVFDQPGTTRDIVTVETAIDGWPVRLTDTAGLRETAVGLEAVGIERARQAIANADLVLEIRDLTHPHDAESETIRVPPERRLLVGNKSDLVTTLAAPAEMSVDHLPVSARTGAGLDALVQSIGARLVPQPPPAGTPLPVHPRWSEWLRHVRAAMQTHDLEAVEMRCNEMRSAD